MVLHGYDVSRWNPPSLAPLVADFAFARASYGLTKDTAAEVHLARMAVHGVKLRGIYQYVTEGGAYSAAEQAAFFVRRVRDLGGDDLALAVDIETPQGHVPAPASFVAALALAFAQAVRASIGRPCATYIDTYEAGRLYAAAPDTMRALAEVSPLWLADFTPPYPVPAPWERFVIHQTGVAKGIDRDESELSLNELRQVFGLCPTPPP